MQTLNKKLVAAAVLAFSPLVSLADGHFYLGGSVGSASLSDDFDGFDVDSSSTAVRFTVGWQFNDYFSVEGGYHNFGSFEQQFDVAGSPVDVRLKADGFLLGGTGTLPLSDKVALYGRVGSFFWDGDADINNVTQAKPEDTNMYIGAGARYAITDRFGVTGDWVRYKLEDTRSDVASIGVMFSFQ